MRRNVIDPLISVASPPKVQAIRSGADRGRSSVILNETVEYLALNTTLDIERGSKILRYQVDSKRST